MVVVAGQAASGSVRAGGVVGAGRTNGLTETCAGPVRSVSAVCSVRAGDAVGAGGVVVAGQASGGTSGTVGVVGAVSTVGAGGSVGGTSLKRLTGLLCLSLGDLGGVVGGLANCESVRYSMGKAV